MHITLVFFLLSGRGPYPCLPVNRGSTVLQIEIITTKFIVNEIEIVQRPIENKTAINVKKRVVKALQNKYEAFTMVQRHEREFWMKYSVKNAINNASQAWSCQNKKQKTKILIKAS